MPSFESSKRKTSEIKTREAIKQNENQSELNPSEAKAKSSNVKIKQRFSLFAKKKERERVSFFSHLEKQQQGFLLSLALRFRSPARSKHIIKASSEIVTGGYRSVSGSEIERARGKNKKINKNKKKLAQNLKITKIKN